jgi:hypothetical protein
LAFDATVVPFCPTEVAFPMKLADLDTPAVTVRLEVMEDNIRRVQAHLDRHGIANRPHIKTHKIPAIGAMQMRGGAAGITCQKIGEVEVFVDAGVADDVLLTYNVLGQAKADRLMVSRRRACGTASTSGSSSSATPGSAAPACRPRRPRSISREPPCGCPGCSSRG